MRTTTIALSLLASAVLMTAQPAAASGGISCSAGEKGVTLDLEGGVTRGMGAPLFSFAGKAGIGDASVAEDLRSTRFKLEHVAQYWLDGEELRLGLYRERAGDKPHGYVQVEMRTTAQGDADEGMYAGTFAIWTWDGTGDGDPKEYRAEGRIECFVE